MLVRGASTPGVSEAMSDELLCHRCGYDLRAHPEDGKCPECGESVAESRRIGAVPLRPAWRNSDPRWRRRMLTGVWILVLLPLMDTLYALGWSSRIAVPTFDAFRHTVNSLDETLLQNMGLFPFFAFCTGMALLFSKERGRRRGRLDWTRRWGVICCYIVLLLRGAGVLFIGSLVMVGISALFMSMPLQYQPGVTGLFVRMSTAYLLYGPYPHDYSAAVLVAAASIAILLACAPLYEALRSTGLRYAAMILPAPLALFALVQLGEAGLYWLGMLSMPPEGFSLLETYFRPQLLVSHPSGLPAFLSTQAVDLFVEAVKWGIVLTIAVWLSVAQLGARREGRGRKT